MNQDLAQQKILKPAISGKKLRTYLDCELEY